MARKTATVMAPTKTKACTGFVKQVNPTKVELVPCGQLIKMGTGDPCPNRFNHVLPMITGFCSSGWHEGDEATNYAGKPAPTCKFYLTCPCKCHVELDKMFNMAEKMRELVNRSEYVPDLGGFVIPEWSAYHMSSSDNDTDTPPVLESPAPGIVPASLARDFGPTATGRAARGELESWVKSKCDEWKIEEYQFDCTPKWIAEEISTDLGIKAPSVGAISAVFERWEKLGFAKVGKKPTRFFDYTEDGIKLGLDKMKANAKRQRDLVRGAQRRSFR